ncbi:MAG: T9SS type A sorting domain-containing protein, partial [candidate division WOR-3 bacterium]
GLWNYGAGIKVSGTAAIINNTIVGNACQGGTWSNGGGIYVDYQDSALIKNNIIVQNSAAGGGGVCNNGFVSLVCNDVWNNSGGNYSGCAPGPGDISLNPLFASGTLGPYYLSHTATGQPATSPCVDAGDTLLWTWPLDLDSLLRSWTTRTDSVPDQGRLDMGFHYPQVAVVGLAERPFKHRSEPGSGCIFCLSPIRAGLVMLRMSGEWSCGPVKVSIFDASGRCVRQSSSDILASSLQLDLRAMLPGIYLIRLDRAGCSTAQKLVVVP